MTINCHPEQEIEIQALRSREVVEPEISKVLRAIEGLAYKGTVKPGRPPSLRSVSSAPCHEVKEEVGIIERTAGEQKHVSA